MRRTLKSSALWRFLFVGAVALLLCVVAAVMLQRRVVARVLPANLSRRAGAPPLPRLRTMKQILQRQLPPAATAVAVAALEESTPTDSILVTPLRVGFSIAVHAHLDKVSDFIRTRGSWEPELLASITREFPPSSGGIDARLFVDVGANIGCALRLLPDFFCALV